MSRREPGRLSRLLSGVGHAVERLPGGGLVMRAAHAAEAEWLELLRDRMQHVQEEGGADAGGHDRMTGIPPFLAAGGMGGGAQADDAGGVPGLGALLERALEQNRGDAMRALCAQILRQLTPDEARILSALADGTRYPLIHVMSGPRVGAANRRLVDNVCNVGRKAGVQLQERVRYYVSHLRALELALTGPEDDAFHTDYEMLETDVLVRRVMDDVEHRGGGQRARIVRRTLYLSEFGAEFWRYCSEQDQGDAAPAEGDGDQASSAD